MATKLCSPITDHGMGKDDAGHYNGVNGL